MVCATLVAAIARITGLASARAPDATAAPTGTTRPPPGHHRCSDDATYGLGNVPPTAAATGAGWEPARACLSAARTVARTEPGGRATTPERTTAGFTPGSYARCQADGG